MSRSGIFQLLPAVARSFALTLQLLPGPLREPLSLAYLLARMSDAVADAPGRCGTERLDLLLGLQNNPFLVAGTHPGFPQSAHPSELRLWAAWEELKAELGASPHREELIRVWRSILTGQIQDIRRALEGTSGIPLPWPDLLSYCDAVAGNVGIFWDALGRKIWNDWSLLGAAEAAEPARNYGRALQLVNIWRDAASDAGSGRVYLDDVDRARALEMIRTGIERGRRYAMTLRSWRVRSATALPAAFAAALFPALKANPAAARLNRKTVRAVLVHTFFCTLARRRFDAP